MAFYKGQPKIGGRKKGSLNKCTKLSHYLLENNINIFEEIWRVYNELEKPLDKMVSLLKILEFIQPKCREIEIPAEENKLIDVTPENVAALYEIARKA